MPNNKQQLNETSRKERLQSQIHDAHVAQSISEHMLALIDKREAVNMAMLINAHDQLNVYGAKGALKELDSIRKIINRAIKLGYNAVSELEEIAMQEILEEEAQ